MLLKPLISDQQMIGCLHTHYDVDVATLALLPLGADINAAVYKAVGRNQISYFIKLKRGHQHDISIAVLQLLQQAGIQHIIAPVKTISGHSTQAIDDFTLIVYPYIEGENGFNRALTDEQWIALGKTLRQVHNVEVPSSIQQQFRRESYSPKWREMVRSFDNVDPVDDEVAQKLWAFMQKNALVIRRLVERAEQLADALRNESPQFVLCHSDIHGGNVLVGENNAIYIVDWDDPIMAPKERDLMFIGGGVANVWNKPHEEALFYEGYGSAAINQTMLAYYRHERIVEDIAEYGQALLLKESGGESRAEMYQHFVAMFEKEGVVDIAMKTERR